MLAIFVLALFIGDCSPWAGRGASSLLAAVAAVSVRCPASETSHVYIVRRPACAE